MVDIWAAYNNTTMPSGTAASPSASYNATLKTVSFNLNSTSATSLIWGTSSAYATSLIWGTNVSGTSLIWGTSNVNGFSLIWGTSSPWAASTTGTTESMAIMINGEK
jgi:hypothetical protein